MRKIILGLAATAVIATPIAMATSANADVAVTDGIGTVAKADVQKALGWNNKAFDEGAGSLKFTAGSQALSNETVWKCGTGTNSRTSTVTQTRNVTATPVYNAGNGKQITGFDLTGMQYQYVSGAYTGAAYVGQCPAGKAFGGFLPNVFKTVVTDGDLEVNGVDLPNTPVETAPAV